MVLTSAEIKQKAIVGGAQPIGERPTTYDATVGHIIEGGSEIEAYNYKLPPRGIVWVISAESFKLPDDVTGLATLRTTWTHNGVLALNVGIIDPGWDGPLAATLVNFSNSDFVIKKGDPFFRIIFHGHSATGVQATGTEMSVYKSNIILRSKLFAKTFLNMESLVSEVAQKVFSIPKFVYNLTILGLALAVIAIFAPIAFSVWTEFYRGPARFEAVEKQIEELKGDLKEQEDLERKLSALQGRLEGLESNVRIRVSSPEPLPLPGTLPNKDHVK